MVSRRVIVAIVIVAACYLTILGRLTGWPWQRLEVRIYDAQAIYCSNGPSPRELLSLPWLPRSRLVLQYYPESRLHMHEYEDSFDTKPPPFGP
jgi:hypothetical protein